MVNEGVTIEELVAIHPQLFHMAEEGTWESIKQNGLLSTTALLDLFGIEGKSRTEIEEANRRTSVIISDTKLGSAVIRDQIPMSDRALDKCLTGMSRAEWYRMLNSRVFFWATKDRVVTLQNARAYRERTNLVMTIDALGLLNAHSDRVSLSPINSGSTIFRPQPRGPHTFLPLSDYPFYDWKKKRSAKCAIVEVTVDYSVPDIADFVTSAVHMRNGEVIDQIV